MREEATSGTFVTASLVRKEGAFAMQILAHFAAGHSQMCQAPKPSWWSQLEYPRRQQWPDPMCNLSTICAYFMDPGIVQW